LPAFRQRALDRIEQTLVAEDPMLGSRFAVFTRLTLNEEMPGTERVRGRLQRFLLAAVRPPLLAISLLTLLAASWVMPGSKQASTMGQDVPALGIHSLNRAAGSQVRGAEPSRP